MMVKCLVERTFSSDHYWSFLFSCRYVSDEKGDPKLHINAQNCLHCKVKHFFSGG
jgi:hypothetical protein